MEGVEVFLFSHFINVFYLTIPRGHWIRVTQRNERRYKRDADQENTYKTTDEFFSNCFIHGFTKWI